MTAARNEDETEAKYQELKNMDTTPTIGEVLENNINKINAIKLREDIPEVTTGM